MSTTDVRSELPTEDEMSIRQYLEKSKIECPENMKRLQSRHPSMTQKVYDNLPFIIYIHQLHDVFYELMDFYDHFDENKMIEVTYYPNCPILMIGEGEVLQIRHTMDLKILILHIIYTSIQEYGDLLEMIVLKKRPINAYLHKKMTSSSFSHTMIQIMDFLSHSYENIEEIGFESILDFMERNKFTQEDVCIFMNKVMRTITSVQNLKTYLLSILHQHPQKCMMKMAINSINH